jgi:hypothetical protein
MRDRAIYEKTLRQTEAFLAAIGFLKAAAPKESAQKPNRTTRIVRPSMAILVY